MNKIIIGDLTNLIHPTYEPFQNDREDEETARGGTEYDGRGENHQ